MSQHTPLNERMCSVLQLHSGVICLSLSILLLTVAYWPALSGPFLLDDFVNLPATQLDQFDFSSLIAITFSNDSGFFGRPIPVFSFALNYLLTGADSTGFKLTNLVIHTINSLLMYFFANMIFQIHVQRHTQELAPGFVRLAAITVALLWALHPLQVSTVMYVVQRMMLMATMFTITALLFYLIARIRLDSGSHCYRYFLLSVICTALALLSKENGVLVLFYIIMLEVFLFQRPTTEARRKLLLAFLSVFCIFPIILGIAYFIGHADSYMEVYSRRDYDLFDRLRTEAVALMFYLNMMLVPDLSRMSLYHDAFPVADSKAIEFWMAVTIISCLILIAFLAKFKATLLSVGIGIFMISHLLESTFLPLELVFEHRNYFALSGVMIPLVWYGLLFLKKVATGPIIAFTLVALTGLSVSMTHARSIEWGDSLHMHAVAVENQPRSLRAITAYAIALSQEGKTDLAIEQYRKAAKLAPEDPYAQLAILNTNCVASRFDADEFDKTLSELPDKKVTKEVVVILIDLVTNSDNGVCERPNSVDLLKLYNAAQHSQNKLLSASEEASMLAYHGLLMYRNGQLADSIPLLKRSVLLDPSNVSVLLQMTGQQLMLGHFDAARESIQRLEIINSGAHGLYDNDLRKLREYLVSAEKSDVAVGSDEL